MSLNLRAPTDGWVGSNQQRSTWPPLLIPGFTGNYSDIVGNTTLMGCSQGHLSSGQEAPGALLVGTVLGSLEASPLKLKRILGLEGRECVQGFRELGLHFSWL